MDTKAALSPADPGELARSMGATAGELFKSLGVSVPLPALVRIQADYVRHAVQIWNRFLAQPGGEVAPQPVGDRRFSAPEWSSNPAAAFTAQMYLLNARALLQMADSVEGDEKTRLRIRFAVQQWVDAASPSNFLALNPEVQRKALETQGESLAKGLQLLLRDLRQGHLSQTDESVFEVGRNVATTPGWVVYENELFQLIEYTPTTKEVHARPLLIVPPCINKYYILDLQPENSLVRYSVEQGHRTFVLSWRNPDESLARITWDDYVEEGVIRAIEVIQDIAGKSNPGGQVNALGFCVGGTILACALAVLQARGEEPVASLTLLTTLLDFGDTGILDVFIDEAAVQMRELTIGEASPSGGGLLKGQELATTFSFLRPNDLVWNYVVGNYLKGENPPPFDLLYWNSDSTNLPGPMFCWYLRNCYHENDLVVPGKATVCGVPLDLGSITAPAYIYGSREDHIVPWEAAYRSVCVLRGPKRFTLGASGHIAGVINPPAKKRRSHWIGPDKPPPTPQQWLQQATEQPGSWWTDWSGWLAGFGGRKIAAPRTPGSRQHKPIEPAPGRYVRARA